MAWPTPAELAVWMGRDELSDGETRRAQLLLDAAIGAVEDAAGQVLLLATDTLVLDGRGAEEILLPRWPVKAVTEVTEHRCGVWSVLDPVSDYSWSDTGGLARHHRCGWPARDRSVRVTYTAGHQKIPDALRRVVLELGARGWLNPAGAGGQQIGATNIQWRALGLELTRGQQQIVDRYRART